MSKKHKKVYWVLNDIEHFPVFVSALNGCFSIPTFAVSMLVLCQLWVNKINHQKKKKKHDEAVLLAKIKVNTINKVLISKASIDS